MVEPGLAEVAFTEEVELTGDGVIVTGGEVMLTSGERGLIGD